MNYRLFVEKREGFRVEAESLRRELNENLQLHIRRMRYLCVYDLFGFSNKTTERIYEVRIKKAIGILRGNGPFNYRIA